MARGTILGTEGCGSAARRRGRGELARRRHPEFLQIRTLTDTECYCPHIHGLVSHAGMRECHCCKLYDTFGFPLDLTVQAAEEHNFRIDLDGFEAAMGEKVRAALRSPRQSLIAVSPGETRREMAAERGAALKVSA